MTDEPTTLLSVRGDAHLEVAPDEATLGYPVGARDADKAAALRVLGHRVEAVTGALRDLGGVLRGVGEQLDPTHPPKRLTTRQGETACSSLPGGHHRDGARAAFAGVPGPWFDFLSGAVTLAS